MSKLLIVQPTYYRVKSDFSLYRTKNRTLTGLTLPYLAALTPPEWDVELVKAKNVFFADSMFAGKKDHSMELMEALIPLKIRWVTLWTAYLCRDQEFMDLAKRSGLLHVNMGISATELEERIRAMYDSFYSPWSMFRRLPLPITKAHITSWVMNVSQRRMSRWDRPVKNHDWI